METDPGVQGEKLSKSSDDTLERRNKSYEKVIDTQIAWIRALRNKSADTGDLYVRYLKKSEWHEKEFGW